MSRKVGWPLLLDAYFVLTTGPSTVTLSPTCVLALLHDMALSPQRGAGVATGGTSALGVGLGAIVAAAIGLFPTVGPASPSFRSSPAPPRRRTPRSVVAIRMVLSPTAASPFRPLVPHASRS